MNRVLIARLTLSSASFGAVSVCAEGPTTDEIRVSIAEADPSATVTLTSAEAAVGYKAVFALAENSVLLVMYASKYHDASI